MRRIIVGLVVGGTLVFMPAPSASAQDIQQLGQSRALDDTSWELNVVPDEFTAERGEQPFDTKMIVKNGTIMFRGHSKPQGFRPSTYTFAPSGDGAILKTEQQSREAGRAIWIGTVHDDRINGTFTWEQPDRTVKHYRFQGAIAEPRQAERVLRRMRTWLNNQGP